MAIHASARRCVAILGGSFDPVHQGHLALATYFVEQLQPDELRLIPVGSPWQKKGLQAGAQHRIEMLRRAFNKMALPVVIDQSEVEHQGFSYTIDTLRALRTLLGPDTSIIFLMGADQLQHLHTWKEWQSLFEYAHICAASRPGFHMDATGIAPAVQAEIFHRTGTLKQIRNTAHGFIYLAHDLTIDLSATEMRAQLQQGLRPNALIPAVVLDYIEQHHLYKN